MLNLNLGRVQNLAIVNRPFPDGRMLNLNFGWVQSPTARSHPLLSHQDALLSGQKGGSKKMGEQTRQAPF